MKIRARKYFLILLVGFLLLESCKDFSHRKMGGLPGKYPFVESWEIRATEHEMVNAITALKKENPDLIPPHQNNVISTRSQEAGEWRLIDFCYTDTKEIVHACMRPGVDTSVTTFAFIGLSKMGDPQDTKRINRECGFISTQKQIEKFKTTIVDKIQERILLLLVFQKTSK